MVDGAASGQASVRRAVVVEVSERMLWTLEIGSGSQQWWVTKVRGGEVAYWLRDGPLRRRNGGGEVGLAGEMRRVECRMEL